MLNALAGVGEQLGRMAERLQAEEELAKLNRRLVELNEEKNQFLGIASHDLKNPLNSIALMGELLKSGELPPAEVAGMGRRIASEAQRTTQLIQKLLDVTAIESGRFNLKFGPGEPGRSCSLQVQAKYREPAEAKGQTIALDFGGRDVLVWADRDYLQEVLDNLVSNALKFMVPVPRAPCTLRLKQDETCGIAGNPGRRSWFQRGRQDSAPSAGSASCRHGPPGAKAPPGSASPSCANWWRACTAGWSWKASWGEERGSACSFRWLRNAGLRGLRPCVSGRAGARRGRGWDRASRSGCAARRWCGW